jgi:hypothetical protein
MSRAARAPSSFNGERDISAGEMTPVDPTKAVGVSLETLQATWSKTQLSNKNVQAFRILVRTRQ